MRKGLEIGRWMPLEIEPLLSSPAMHVWFDDQKWWYIALLMRAWQNAENPCHLPNDSEKLRVLAGVPMKRKAQWKERSPEVLAKFDVSSDGLWITNRKQLEVYANQLASRDARRDAGSKGGKARAEKLAKCSNATHLLPVCLSSTSHSLSTSDSQKEKRDLDSEELLARVMAIGFRDSNWRSKSQIERALFEEIESGSDPTEMLEALCRIYRWTQNGEFARKCFEVIPRWREPQNYWERRNGKSDGVNQQTSRAKLRADESAAAIKGAFGKLREQAGAADAEPS